MHGLKHFFCSFIGFLSFSYNKLFIFYKSQFTAIHLIANESSIGENFQVKKGVKFDLGQNTNIKIGNNVTLADNVHFYVGDNARLIIEDNVFIGRFSVIAVNERLHIGHNTQISHFVTVIDTDHDFNSQAKAYKGVTTPIFIGKDVLIGAQSVILRGKTIGDHAVIGAGSVVTTNIPEKHIARGNPAQSIEY